MKSVFIISTVVMFALIVHGETTIRIGVNNLPVGTQLGEQFSNVGVHFLGSGRYDFPSVSAAPTFPGPPANHVVFAGNISRDLGILFDYRVVSVSMDVATEVVRPEAANGNPDLSLVLADSYPTTTVRWNDIVHLASFDRWEHVVMNVPSDRVGRLLEIQADDIFQNVNYGANAYFANIDVTLVPEPSTWGLGGISLILLFCDRTFGRKALSRYFTKRCPPAHSPTSIVRKCEMRPPE